jgi:hypothetical protein
MKADRGAVPGLQSPDRLPTRDPLSLDQGRTHWLVAREDTARVGDRQDVAVDNEPDEVHDPVGGRVNGPARGNVDAAMARRILGRRCDEWPDDLMRPAHRPRPARFARRRGRANGHAADHEADEEREAKHPLIVGKTRWAAAGRGKQGAQPGRNAASGGAVLPLTKHPAPSDDYACPLFRQWNAHIHPVLPNSSSSDRACRDRVVVCGHQVPRQTVRITTE